MQQRRIDNIECLEINNDSENTVIMFHGYGADYRDLSSLANELDPNKKYNWLFPNGLLDVAIGPGSVGRAWWPINMAELDKLSRDGYPANYSERIPIGLDLARNQVTQVIQLLELPWNNIVLGGFSQGAMLATDLFLRAESNPKGLIIYSGSLICKEAWTDRANLHEGAKFFQSHGKNDPILNHKFAGQLNTLLTTNGLKGSLNTFIGGHEIPPNIIAKSSQYLEDIY